MGTLGTIIGRRGPSWARLGQLGAILGPSWAILGPPWGRLWRYLGPSQGPLEGLLGPARAIMGYGRVVLGLFSNHGGSKFNYNTTNALPLLIQSTSIRYSPLAFRFIARQVCDSVCDSTVGSDPLRIAFNSLQIHLSSLCADAHGNTLVHIYIYIHVYVYIHI